MNWKEISEKYPKSAELFNKWHPEGIIYDRNLYDFFDENEIYCSVYFDVSSQQFIWEVAEKNDDGTFTGDGGEAKDRTQGEETVFEIAFELLEEKQ